MFRLAHQASIAVSVLVGVVLAWLVLREPLPPHLEEQVRAQLPEPPPLELQETPKAALTTAVVLPPPPSPLPAPTPPQPKAEPAKATPKPQAAPAPEPKQQTAPAPEPKPQSAPAAAPEPVPAAAPQTAAPVLEPPMAEASPEPAYEPAPLPETAPAAPESEPMKIKPLKPMERPKPAEAEVAPAQPLRALQPAPKAKEPEPEIAVEPLRPSPVPAPKPVREARPVPPTPREPPPVPLTAAAAPKRENRPAAISAEAALTAPDTVQVSFRPDTEMVKDGRALLLILEHGSGPGIEIYWPDDRGQRERLYRTLNACYGMRTALMDSGRLYVAEGARGQPWVPSMDRFSGFMRQPSGALTPEEQREAAGVAQYHGFGRSLRIIRIFPRTVDAALLGGLRTLIGDRYAQARAIVADYRDTSAGLFVENIRVDGAAVAGRIAFPRLRNPGCT